MTLKEIINKLENWQEDTVCDLTNTNADYTLKERYYYNADAEALRRAIMELKTLEHKKNNNINFG